MNTIKTVPSSCDELIDLRPIFKALWKGKWAILSFVVLFTAFAAGLTFSLMTPQYQTSALVFVEFPRIPGKIGSYVPSTYNVPDLKSLAAALHDDSVLNQVIVDEQINLITFRAHSWVTTVGRQGLKLYVRDTDPQRAARLANRWAHLVDDVLRTLYGLETLEDQWNYLVQSVKLQYQSLDNQLRKLANNENFARADLEWSWLINVAYPCHQAYRALAESAQADIAQMRTRLQRLEPEQRISDQDALRIWRWLSMDWQAMACFPESISAGVVV
ncbi:MAG: hypothetical protein GXO54_04535, partial [Chloroflexi bacterium]|nr:hypothetical protein [Chloroflexota bacterium]